MCDAEDKKKTRPNGAWETILRKAMISSGIFEGDSGHPEDIRVMVVDDNAINRKVIVAILAELGTGAACATDGYEGVHLFMQLHPDLVLMDLHMPVLNGLEATRRIRALEKEFQWKHSWIVAVTADTSPAIREACFAEGADGFLLKPIRRAEIAEALRDAVRMHQGACLITEPVLSPMVLNDQVLRLSTTMTRPNRAIRLVTPATAVLTTDEASHLTATNTGIFDRVFLF